ETCSVGLAGVLDLSTLLTKPPLEPHHLGRLARPFDALERDQYAAHAPENLRGHDSTAPRRPGIAGRRAVWPSVAVFRRAVGSAGGAPAAGPSEGAACRRPRSRPPPSSSHPPATDRSLRRDHRG